MSDVLALIPDAFESRDGLPRPNWEVIAGWVDANVVPSAFNETWTQIAIEWLNRLSKSLPSDYSIQESTEFLLLAPDQTVGNRILEFSENARQVILRTLDGVTRDSGFGKHVILLFDNIERYYDYVADFYPSEGEFALSGGLFINSGYGHFVLCPAVDEAYDRVIAHELNHVLLQHLPLPLWLNEGVTQIIEDIVVESSYFMVDQEILGRHRSYWNVETIDAFWSGDSFLFPDDGQELSYHLAQVLFRNLMSDHPKAIAKILNQAHFSDAGNTAFVDCCKESLADRAGQFLGAGDWGPRNDYGLMDTQ